MNGHEATITQLEHDVWWVQCECWWEIEETRQDWAEAMLVNHQDHPEDDPL